MRHIGDVGPGEFFGEAGMYGAQPAETRAIALRDAEILRLAPDVARVLPESSPRQARDSGARSMSDAGHLPRRTGR